MPVRTQQAVVEQELGGKPSNACHRCWDSNRGIYIMTRVMLTSGSHLKEICYKVQCPKCRHIASYGDKLGICKFDGYRYDFNYQYWSEFREYNLDPDKFIEYLIDNPYTRYVPVSKIREAQAEQRTRPAFYEPMAASVGA